MENLNGFTYPTAAKCEEIVIFDQNSYLRLKTFLKTAKILSVLYEKKNQIAEYEFQQKQNKTKHNPVSMCISLQKQ